MEDQRSSKKMIFASLGVALLMLMGARVAAANAASLYLSPSSAGSAPGQGFTLTVGVSSPDHAANAVSGTVSFPVDKVQVTDVSKSGSVLGLWVKEPSFSNTNGTVSFEGIILNPGFKGNAGKVISVSFKAKAAGTASIVLSSGSILANDGLGTNITEGLGRSTITIEGHAEPVQPPPTVGVSPPPTVGLPPPPVIASSSHPDSNAWYAKNVADLHWLLTKGVTGVSVLVDQKSATVPGTVSDGLFNDYSTVSLGDGVWYFHVRLKNAAGWGPAAHYRLQIDTVAPKDFVIKLIDGSETNNTQPTVVFNTTDALSGIDHYEVKVGEDNSIFVSAVDVQSNPYTLPTQQLGTHRILVVAYDAAGNHTSTSADFTIESLNKPIIVQYPIKLRAGDFLTVKGRTDYPNAQVHIWIRAYDGPAAEAVVQADANGAFAYTVDGKMRPGIFKLWAQVNDGRGGLSATSDEVTVVVEAPYLLVFAGRGINIWFVIVLVSVIFIVLTLLYWRARKRFADYQKKFTKNVADTKESMHLVFNALKENMFEKLKVIEQSHRDKRFSEVEKKMISDFRKDLNGVEKNLEKHIDCIKMLKKR